MPAKVKATKVTGRNPAKKSPRKTKKQGNAKKTKEKGSVKTKSSTTTQNTVEKKSRKPKTTTLPNNGSSSAVQTAADERRLRKLKVYLKSVSYNGCEGTNLPNLNDLYCDQLLVDEFPCNELSKNEEFKCNPTPFVIASCFNRNQVTDNNNSKGNKGSRRAPRNPNGTPRKRNQPKPDLNVTRRQETPLKPSTAIMIPPRKNISAVIRISPIDKVFKDKGEKLEQVKAKEEGNKSSKSPAPLEEKKADIKDEKKIIVSPVK